MTASSRSEPISPAASPAAKLSRQVGLFDATMLVMGGIIGNGIFITPYVVALRVHTPLLILGTWLAGAVVAILGAFIYAELADRRPDVGGQYAYLRDAFHPALGFLYGWVLLLVIQTGGMAAVTVTFARFFLDLAGLRAPEKLVAVVALALLTLINCLGVKFGSRVQSALMVAKIVAIAALVVICLWLVPAPHPIMTRALDQPPSFSLLTGFGAAMVPVLFSYGGWQTANFVAGEIKDPRRNLSRALLIGVAAVVVLYVTVNVSYLRALGSDGLAATTIPASDAIRVALGERGARFLAFAITVSAIGFLSQSILTAPRVYFAMAEDGLFFRSVASVSASTRVPVVAIVLQSVWTAVIALSGRFEQILNYVVSMDFLFFGLTAASIFVFRRRERAAPARSPGYRIPGHPVTTLIFIAAAWAVVANTIYRFPANSLLGMAFLALGFPVYLLWAAARRVKASAA